MASRKKGTGLSLTQREKLAIVRYSEEITNQNAELRKKEICEKDARMFDIHHTVAFKILDHFKASKCVEAPKKKGRPKVNYKTNPAFYYIKEELGRQIHSFHANKQHFTLHDLHKYAVEECEFICKSSIIEKSLSSNLI
nr:PREDICTED: uncharacterized protein LOC103312768 isoform X3 [Tribolium castaneum]|eukprot:XP_015835148.1 PREDICTED: uncharacterized protein LOC103312768 isoform X3 [Tribolium castaneum]